MVGPALELNVTVPSGATAEAYFPQLSQIGGTALTIVDTAAGKAVWKAGKFAPGVAGVYGATLSAPVAHGPDKGLQSVVLELGSGTYPFRVAA